MDKKQPPQPKDEHATQRAAKRTYAPPQLVALGDLQSITHADVSVIVE